MIAHLRPIDRGLALVTGVVVTVLSAVVVGWSAGVAVVGAMAILAGLAWRARRDVGGVTGDILGAACMLVELWVLVVVVSTMVRAAGA